MKESKHDSFDEALTMTIRDVADALKCTDRHIYNMRKEGRTPLPFITGKAKGVRWSRKVIEEWINAGCPAIAV